MASELIKHRRSRRRSATCTAQIADSDQTVEVADASGYRRNFEEIYSGKLPLGESNRDELER